MERALQKVKRATKAKKKTQRTGSKKQIISSEDEMENSANDDDDTLEPLEVEILDCIEVAE
jgi:hypothetical protein